MRVAYIVAAHRGLDQLERLLRRIADERSALVVHVDAKADDGAYDALVRRTDDLGVRYLERHRGYWGGFGVVRAALKGIRYLVESATPFDYAVLLSGQDYPLRPQSAIRAELERAGGRSFVNHFRLPYDGWGDRGGFNRVEDWHLVSHVALHLRLPWERRLPNGLEPYGGERSWLLQRRAVEYVDDYVRDNPSVVRFFEHTLHPSELFFQTLLLNSPLAGTFVNDHRHHIRWRGGASPATLTMADLGELLESDCLFARKFDPDVDEQVLDRLDAHLERRVDVVAC